MSYLYVADGYVEPGYVQSGITIDWQHRIIYVPRFVLSVIQYTPTTIYELDLSVFKSRLKELEMSEQGMLYPNTHNHNPPLAIGGVTLARVIELINGYTVTFEDGQYAVNLVGGNSNVADKVNVNQVSVRSANSAGLIQLKEMQEATEATKRMIEGLRPHHKGYGNIWYYDPNNGNDSYDGRTPTRGFLTFTKAHASAQDYGHDIILVVPSGTGVTSISEPLIITKNFLFIRGMGFNAHLHPLTRNPDSSLVSISGRGVELSGFHIEGMNVLTSGTTGVNITGDHVFLNNCTVEDCTGDGVVITTTALDDRAIIDNCYIRANGGRGLVYNSGNHLEVRDTEFEDNVGHGADLTVAGAIDGPLFHHCNFTNNGGYGLKIGTGALATTIESECLFSTNTLGDILDNGTGTIRQSDINNMRIAHAVWDEPISEHTTVGSFGHFVQKKLLTFAKYIGIK